VYQWALPEDIQPFREAVIALAHGHVDIIIFMNAAQVAHLFVMADHMGYSDALHEEFRTTVIGSIGPSTTRGPTRTASCPITNQRNRRWDF